MKSLDFNILTINAQKSVRPIGAELLFIRYQRLYYLNYNFKNELILLKSPRECRRS